ncbi:MAG: tripartite tricarboxylate transporter substrate binding protein [Deltaproteobacteria bacterium]|nr:tripartite tricarboxylate transporter substrate binding protein [Deltaproteobacteria bacterium]
MKKHWVVLFLLVGFLFHLSLAGSVQAAPEKFPSRPVTIMVGYAAGGTTDVAVRALAEATSKIIGQPVVVVNKPGAGTTIMMADLKNQKPDGHTVGIMSSGAIIGHFLQKVPYHPVNDFDSVLQVSAFNYGIAVRSDSPWKNIGDLLAYAKANPGKVKYTGSGANSPAHLIMIQLGEAAGVTWTHIPFQGGAEAATNVMGGHCDVTCSPTEWKPGVDSGRLRLIACAMDKRFKAYPKVPTLIEEGYKVKGYGYLAVVGPKGMPKDRVKILQDAFHQAMNDPAYQKTLDSLLFPTIYRNSADCDKYTQELVATLGPLVEKVKK